MLCHVCVTVAACTEIGGLDGLLATILTCTLRSPRYVPTVSRFDLVILVGFHRIWLFCLGTDSCLSCANRSRYESCLSVCPSICLSCTIFLVENKKCRKPKICLNVPQEWNDHCANFQFKQSEARLTVAQSGVRVHIARRMNTYSIGSW